MMKTWQCVEFSKYVELKSKFVQYIYIDRYCIWVVTFKYGEHNFVLDCFIIINHTLKSPIKEKDVHCIFKTSE